MEEKTIELNELLQAEKITEENLPISENDVLVIPQARLSEDDIDVIKKIRADHKKVYIHNREQTQFKDFRGGEYALALLIGTSVVLPFITTVASNWITNRIEDWNKKKKENKKSEVQPPNFKMEFYVTDKKKYVKIEGDSSTALKALDNLKDL